MPTNRQLAFSTHKEREQLQSSDQYNFLQENSTHFCFCHMSTLFTETSLLLITGISSPCLKNSGPLNHNLLDLDFFTLSGRLATPAGLTLV